jgi:sugar lactone lactonase YvrE
MRYQMPDRLNLSVLLRDRVMSLTAEPILQARAPLGEGAIWNYRDNVLHWVDIDDFKIHTFDPATNQDSSIDVGEYVGTVVRRAPECGGGFIVALTQTIAHVDDAGKVTKLADVDEPPRNRSNDGKCDPAGRFWFGSFNFDLTPGACNFWMMERDHTLHHKLDKIGVSNGLVWTADQSTMYYIDSLSQRLDAFDYNIETGRISNRRSTVKNSWGGYFDGMTIDAEDNVYIALWEGGAVLKLNPRTGKLIERIEIPGCGNITSCAFGGPRLSDLYITSSAKDAKAGNEPNAGALFKITLSDTEGCKAFEYRG